MLCAWYVCCGAVGPCGLCWLLRSLDCWPQGALCSLHEDVVGLSWGSVLGVQVLRSFPQGPRCPGDVLCDGVVLGVSLGSTVICVGCPGPWILVRKMRCAQVMFSAMVLSLVLSAMVSSLESEDP